MRPATLGRKKRSSNLHATYRELKLKSMFVSCISPHVPPSVPGIVIH